MLSCFSLSNAPKPQQKHYGLLFLFLYLSAVWLGVDLKTDNKKDIVCSKEIGLRAQKFLDSSSQHNWRDLCDHSFSELENPHFDNE